MVWWLKFEVCHFIKLFFVNLYLNCQVVLTVILWFGCSHRLLFLQMFQCVWMRGMMAVSHLSLSAVGVPQLSAARLLPLRPAVGRHQPHVLRHLHRRVWRRDGGHGADEERRLHGWRGRGGWGGRAAATNSWTRKRRRRGWKDSTKESKWKKGWLTKVEKQTERERAPPKRRRWPRIFFTGFHGIIFIFPFLYFQNFPKCPSNSKFWLRQLGDEQWSSTYAHGQKTNTVLKSSDSSPLCLLIIMIVPLWSVSFSHFVNLETVETWENDWYLNGHIFILFFEWESAVIVVSKTWSTEDCLT